MDVSILHDFLISSDELGINAGCSVIDRDYFSKTTLAHLIRSDCKAFIAPKFYEAWLQEYFDEAIMRMHTTAKCVAPDVLGDTVNISFEDNDGNTLNAYLHVFCEQSLKNSKKASFEESLVLFERNWQNCSDEATAMVLKHNSMLRWFEKPTCEPGKGELVRNTEAITTFVNRLGIFATVSTMECNADLAFSACRHHNSVANCIRLDRSYSIEHMRYHSLDENSGQTFITFLALMLDCELQNRMNAPDSMVIEADSSLRLSDEFASSYELLASVSPISGCSGYISEVTQSQKSIAKRLGLDGVFDAFPSHLYV